MRISELQLIAFGPFTHCRLDLSSGQQGLHILYGPNEAGKSSSLRAITDLLYGFPARTADDFQHPYKNLRVGGLLQHSDGSQLSIVRRKANQKSLRCAQDSEPVADETLLRFLGDVDQEFFRTMFGINHERLRRGGQDIAAGKGQLGQLLFAAGAGLINLQQLQNDLQSEADALLKPTLRSGTIHQHLQDYQEQRRAVVAAQVSVETWKKCEEQCQLVRQRKNAIDQQMSQLSGELARLQRIQAASASIDRWKTRQQKLHQFSHVPRLDADFVPRANQWLLELKTGQVQNNTAAAELEKLDCQLQALVVPSAILAACTAIEALRDRVGGVRKSLADRPSVEARRDTAEQEMMDLLRDLDRTPDLSTIEELRLPRDRMIKIQSLGSQLPRQLEKLQAERKTCEVLRAEIAAAELRLSAHRVTIDLTACRAALRRIQQQGDVQTELTQAKNARDQLLRELELGLKKLPLFDGQLAELECLAFPSATSLDRFENDLANVDRQLQALQNLMVEDEQKRELLNAQFAQLDSGQAVPTLAELQRLRQLRQEGWQLVLASWKSRPTDEKKVSNFLRNFPDANDLTSAYPQAVLQADQVADTLRTDADRVATKAKLHSDLEQLNKRHSKRLAEYQQNEALRNDITLRWQKLWEPVGIEPLGPSEMQAWLRQVAELTYQLSQLRNREAECQLKQSELNELTERLQRLAAQLSTDIGDSPRQAEPQPFIGATSFRELTQWVDDQLNSMSDQASRWEQSRLQLREDQTKLTAAQAEVAECQIEVSRLQNEWSEEMSRLGLAKDAYPEQANSRLLTIQDLFDKAKDVDRFRSRLQHIDRDAQLFAEDVSVLCATLAPEHQTLPAETALNELLQLLEQARIAQREQTALTARRVELAAVLIETEQRCQQATVQLDEMLRQAKVCEYEQLGPAADQSRERHQHELAIAELEDEIAGYCAGARLADFVAEVEQEQRQPQPLDQRIERSQQLQNEWQQQRDILLGQIAAAEIELAKFDGSSDAADADAHCESIAALLEDELQALAVRRVAASVLKEAIERHRERNQGPILGRASEIFRQITVENFTGLQAEYNQSGEPVLAGVRSGARVLVEGMSDGTCDQLYLALRLASLEAWLEHHEPIPLIVDDILMNFDDARSVATLQVLAQLSQKTQVIFFTHHQHLVDLAREHLCSTELFVTNIPGRS